MSELTAGPDGRIDPAQFALRMRDKVQQSGLAGTVPGWGRQFGITTGSPDEWARFFTMLQQQESGHRVAQVAPDGSLQAFPTTPRGERSYGPGQFNVGEYGLKTWADVNNPERVADAYIQVARSNRIPAYFGSVQRPHETAQHADWYDRTVAPQVGRTGWSAYDQDNDPNPPELRAPTPPMAATASAAPGAAPAQGGGQQQSRQAAVHSFTPISMPRPTDAQSILNLGAIGLGQRSAGLNTYGQNFQSVGDLVRRRT